MKAHGVIFLFLVWASLMPFTGRAASEMPEKLSLSNVIEIALKSYPEIEALRARVDQASARHQGAPSLPPPMVSVGTMGERGPFASQGRMENSIELSQTVPFPTKLSAEADERRLEGRVAAEQLESRMRALRAEAKTAYFELFRSREQIRLLGEKRAVLEQHAKRIRSVTLSDRMTQAHLIRIQNEIALVQIEIEKTHQQEKVAQGTLNAAMGRDPGLSVGDLEEPALAKLPLESDVIGGEKALGEHPEIRARVAAEDAIEASQSRANAAWLPDFTFKYRYNRRLDGLMPNNTEVMVGIDLPFLFFWQPKGKIAESSASLREAQALRHQSFNDLKLQLLKARTQAESLKGQLQSFEKSILPQAQKRLKVAHSIAPTDMESLTEHRESMENYVDLQMVALNIRVEFEKAVAEVERLSPQSQEPH